MARKPLRSQLNQIRAWVRQGRTDAWIAHQLDIPASELREFRRRHELSPEDEDGGEVELRDEIEAEIEALSETDEEEPAAAEGEDEEGQEAEEPREEEATGGRRRRRRRRRRGGGGGDRAGAAMQATFDHGEKDGFGLWLDPAVEDDPVYSEHWAGHRRVEVTIEPDRIVIRRV
ncbi:MAG TPA: hypothetical protein VHR37_01650 [Solirubrobacterales bacterium]|jgi:hypothetical protein|nr:hypothetical protein [Solirubrobacterales bacterium]